MSTWSLSNYHQTTVPNDQAPLERRERNDSKTTEIGMLHSTSATKLYRTSPDNVTKRYGVTLKKAAANE